MATPEPEQKCWHCGVVFEGADDALFHFCRDNQESERDFDWNDADESEASE